MGLNPPNRSPVGAHSRRGELYDCWFDGVTHRVSGFATLWRVLSLQGLSFGLSLRLISEGKMEDGVDYSWPLNCLVGSTTQRQGSHSGNALLFTGLFLHLVFSVADGGVC